MRTAPAGGEKAHCRQFGAGPGPPGHSSLGEPAVFPRLNAKCNCSRLRLHSPTPALSPGEKEFVSERLESSPALAVAALVECAWDAPSSEQRHFVPARQLVLPLPGGEGRGEGGRR